MTKANEVIEHLFRHESGHIISRLSARYGMLHLSEIEDAVSESLVRAMKTWSVIFPNQTAAWLYSVASRIVIDTLRRKQLYSEKIIPEYKVQSLDDADQEDKYATIKLMLWCVHPSLNTQDQLGLILQLVSGFSIKEIGSALLVNEEKLKKRLQRARAKLKAIEGELVLPDINNVKDRYPTLRSALYLGFNEGYYSIHHENVLREDLIYESLRLCKLLCDTPHSDLGVSQALMSLMLYHTSRIPSRRSADNSLILFEHQDRSLWDSKMIRLASDYMEQAMYSEYNTPYHIEAVIAGIHTQTQNFEDTDWGTIGKLYSKLFTVTPNPMIELNFIYALLMAGDLQKSKEFFKKSNPFNFGVHNYLYHSVYAMYFDKINDQKSRKFQLWNAIENAPNKAIRNVLRNRLEGITQGD